MQRAFAAAALNFTFTVCGYSFSITSSERFRSPCAIVWSGRFFASSCIFTRTFSVSSVTGMSSSSSVSSSFFTSICKLSNHQLFRFCAGILTFSEVLVFRKGAQLRSPEEAASCLKGTGVCFRREGCHPFREAA